MTYPGNPSLAKDVQERISNTFQQTLDLVTENKHQEAQVGCEFILRMDPQFQPAKTLVERLESGQVPVTVDDLRAPSDGGASPVGEPGSDELGSLDDLDELGSLDDLEGLGDLDDLDLGDDLPAEPSPAATVAAGPPASGLATVLQDLMAKRSFDQILQIAESQKQAVAADPAVQTLVEKARSLSESETYVQTFLRAANEARAAGQIEEMEKQLAKARALDPEHPELVSFATEPRAMPAPGAAAAGEPAPGAAAPGADDDLMALQQQSLSLDSAADPVAELSDDPRQTKPLSAVPPDDEAPADVAGEIGESEDLFGSEELEADDAEVGDFGDFGDDGFEARDDAPGTLDDVVPEGPEEELVFGDEPAAATDAGEEEGDRTQHLLAEGQEAFDRGEYQAAIDVWSRIFLIDIDNQEASTRIEEARSKKAEIERQAEELFHEAAGQIESQSLDDAKSTLARVLELVPGHSLAREYLDQLEAGKVPTPAATADLDMALEDVDVDADDDDDFPDSELSEPAGSPSLEAAVERDRMVAVKRTDKKLVAIGAAVLLVVLGLVGFLSLQWNVLFPTQEAPPTAAQQPRKVDPIERATKMHEGDQTENAILLLERIQPEDPVYEDAQALIAQWRAHVEAPPEADTGPSEEQLARHNLLLSGAREAHQQRRCIRALKYFDLAAKILPIEADDQALVTACNDKLDPLRDQISLYEQGQYAAIIPELWRRRENDPANLDLERLLVDSYYNLALTDLQRGNARGAASKASEALEVQPDNEELQRLKLFAQTYVQRQHDLLYRIFVKYLPSR